MEVYYYRFNNREVVQIEEEIPPERWEAEADWVGIRCDNREEIIGYFSSFSLSKGRIEFLLHPENHPLPATDNEYIIQNFIISKAENAYESDYITLIIKSDLIISIIPKSNNLKEHEEQPEHIREQFTDLRFYFAYNLGTEIFNQSIFNMGMARKRLRLMEDVLINNPEKLNSSQVMNTLSDIGHLVDIMEDQYVGFGMFSSFLVNKEKEQDRQKLKEVLDSFAELNRLIVRLEEKAESFRYQFMLIHQENSARRINILTIIQAIFVPLTFLAGVYGMNFENMPELGWRYAYYFVWGIFVTLSAVLMVYFKKKGWFD